MTVFILLGCHEEGKSFGVIKKGKSSDFHFDFVAEVICEDPHSSGFMVELTPDRLPSTASETDEAAAAAATGRCVVLMTLLWYLSLLFSLPNHFLCKALKSLF